MGAEQGAALAPFFGAGGLVYTIRIDRQGTADPADDVYTVTNPNTASAYWIRFENLQARDDALGSFKAGSGADAARREGHITLFDITEVLGGGLDYVQLGRLSGNMSGRVGETYFAIGPARQPTSLPSAGQARYRGETRGTYVDAAGQAFATASEIALTADFAALSISGVADNFKVMDGAGHLVSLPASLDFTFSGAIDHPSTVRAGFSGTGGNGLLQGVVQGEFYGELGGLAPEIGLSYAFTGTGVTPPDGPYMIGVGGLKQD